MPQGMDFWVDLYAEVDGADYKVLSAFAAEYEGTAATYEGSTHLFAVPSRRTEELFAALIRQHWYAGGAKIDRRVYGDGEYFDPAKPVGERFLFGFAG